MAIHHQSTTSWHIALLTLALGALASSSTSAVASAFSSMPGNGRPFLSKRAKRGASLTTTRRVFCLTLAGGAHNMFAGMRAKDKKRQSTAAAAPSSSTTSLDYRGVCIDGYCEDVGIDIDCASGYTDGMWQAALDSRADELGVDAKTDRGADNDSRRRRHWANRLDDRFDGQSTDGIDHPTSASPGEGGMKETAKAFIPVAVEIGLVAGLAAANVHILN